VPERFGPKILGSEFARPNSQANEGNPNQKT